MSCYSAQVSRITVSIMQAPHMAFGQPPHMKVLFEATRRYNEAGMQARSVNVLKTNSILNIA